ncbi:hypothetical protein LEP1GSC043_4363 [Leptospira weilii str. Ecochallenge]|uniref:Uncharacterized protein n=2 Tax=Leptospira weilii TaxID=28184 RepID=N1UCV8_9LEPT|nr:hypothetical protein LEP1GSC051_4475 [Leptospira sp. P2653]EMN87881.1 hypothetical protein LEP1GSC108_0838 [Leptospira weilii str. UI 13098]EMY16006.1 hypothetical protein LEP1GSC043_4363 [Leptospira weilii str. Ecochallenge]
MVFCEICERIIGFDYTNSFQLVNCFLLAHFSFAKSKFLSCELKTRQLKKAFV